MNARAAVKHSDFVRLMFDDGASMPAQKQQDPRLVPLLIPTGITRDANGIGTYTYTWTQSTPIRYVTINGTVGI